MPTELKPALSKPPSFFRLKLVGFFWQDLSGALRFQRTDGAYFLRFLARGRKENLAVVKAKKILAPTDLSKVSQAAVRYALEIGWEQDAEVIIYNVIGEDGDWFGKDDSLNPAAAILPRQNQRLQELVRDQFGDLVGKVRVRELVEVGLPYLLIVRKAEEENADLIVMSTHGRTGLEQLMLGSVTAKVLARASCPVLVLPPTKTSGR
jgi:nucleotide-binding universal stress UspA family protein